MLNDQTQRPFVRRFLGLSALVAVGLLIFLLVSTGQVEWKLVTLVGFLWAAWSFIGGLYSQVIEPAGRFLANQLTGNVSMPGTTETIDEQTARLERLLEQETAPHHEIMVGIRLAEIYRTRQKDSAKSDALLARLRAKYPDAPELTHAEPR
ncbi:MAG TPA: hypothetical protein VJ816_04400 [Gemmatimonadales bacterium]|nr:hypothetical protein [Gemmatimonadales bacterium]